MQLDGLLEQLKLNHLSLQIDAILEQAAKRDLGYREVLTEALACEWAGRRQKGTETRLAQARLPWHKTLDQFDFSFQPSIDRKVIGELATLGFVDRAENVVLLGPPGGGQDPHRHRPGNQSRRGGPPRIIFDPAGTHGAPEEGPRREPTGQATAAAELSEGLDPR